MRLWSLHPKYLDRNGLIAVWREGLLAKKVLEGKTKGYKKHPQLIRFLNQKYPLNSINLYLYFVYCESQKRGYLFNKIKIGEIRQFKEKISVNSQQVKFEFKHLLSKLEKRDPLHYKKLLRTKNIKAHPLFIIKTGKVETWEKI